MSRVLIGIAIAGILLSAAAVTRPNLFGMGGREFTTAAVGQPIAVPAAPRGRQGFGGFGGGFGPPQDLAVVAQFDQNGDRRLNAAERRAARAYLQSQGRMAPGGRRFGGG